MKSEYRPQTLRQKLGYLVEECGEVLAATGKTLRWGIFSYNPDLPSKERETNGRWILRELGDLKEAIKIAEAELHLRLFQNSGNNEITDLPPLDVLETAAVNRRLTKLIREHIWGLPGPAAKEWQKLLDRAFKGEEEE